MLASKIESIKTWAIIILVIVVVLGGIRLKRQADLLEAHANATRHREQQDYEMVQAAKDFDREEYRTWEYATLITAMVEEIRGGANSDDEVHGLSPEEQEGWIAGKRDGYAAGQAQVDVMTTFTAPESDDGAYFYGTAYLANYLRACVEQKRECPQLNIPLEIWFSLPNPDQPTTSNPEYAS